MQTVYLVYRRAFDKCKLGFTIDLPFRLLSPNELRISNRRSWKVIYTEKFEAKKAAMQREKELKSGVGRVYIWKN